MMTKPAARGVKIMNRGHLSGTVCAMLMLLGTCPLRAQVTTPQPYLTSIVPAVLQAGATREVTVMGTALEGASTLHFSIPGAEVKPKLDAKQKPVANTFIVSLPAGAASGPCDVSVVGRYGISNPRGVQITSLPVVAVPGAATSAEKPFKTELNRVLTSVTLKQDSTFISFDAKKGQHVLAICRPAWLDSRLEASLEVQGPDGHVLERLHTDGVLDLTVPADGAYLLRLSDLMYRGNAELPYAITLTTGPLVEYAFDGGVTWVLYGRNLPNSSPSVKCFGKTLERVQVPAAAANKLLAQNAVKPVHFGAESEPAGGDTTKPVPLKVPATFTGWFPEGGKARYFTFDGHKGDVFWIEVGCASRGMPADPFLSLEKMGKAGPEFIVEANDRAAIAAKDEFDGGWADPYHRFDVKEDGTYRIKLRNLYSREPSEPFQLTLSTPAAGKGFDLVAMPAWLPKAKAATTVELSSAPLWRGGVAAFKVFALRHEGFNGPIDLAAEALPAGVSFGGGLVREGQNIGYATFVADEKAGNWGGAVKLHGSSGGNAIGATVVFKVASTVKETLVTRFTDEVTLGVVAGDAPVLIEAAAPAEAVAGSKVSIPLQVKRRGDFNEAMKLTALGLNDATAEVDVPAKATSAKLDLDLAKLKLPAGDYQVVLQGTAKFKPKLADDPKAAAKDVTFLVHSRSISLHVKPVEPKKK